MSHWGHLLVRQFHPSQGGYFSLGLPTCQSSLEMTSQTHLEVYVTDLGAGSHQVDEDYEPSRYYITEAHQNPRTNDKDAEPRRVAEKEPREGI